MTIKQTITAYQRFNVLFRPTTDDARIAELRDVARERLAVHKVQVVQSWDVEPSYFMVTKHSGFADPLYLMEEGSWGEMSSLYDSPRMFASLDEANLAALDAIKREA
jgi:hypothetical protein